MRKTEKSNCPAGTAGVNLKARIALCEAAQLISNMLIRYPEKPTLIERHKHFNTWNKVRLSCALMEWVPALCRRHTAWTADDLLEDVDQQDAEEEFVEMIYPQVPLDDDETLQFDHTSPQMWRCCPTEQEYERMETVIEEMITVAKEAQGDVSQEFEQRVAAAAETFYFEELLLNAFAGPAFVALIGKDNDRVMKICLKWVEKSETTQATQCEAVQRAVFEIDTFCDAVVALFNEVPSSTAGHDAIVKMFGPQAQPSPWACTLVEAFRQSEGFEAREKEALRAIPFESKHRAQFFTFKNSAFDDESVGHAMSKFPTWSGPGGFRVGHCEWLEEKCWEYLEGRIKALAEDHDNNLCTQAERRTKILALGEIIEFWKGFPDLADDVKSLRSLCSSTARKLDASAAGKELSKAVDDDNVFREVLGQRLDQMKGHEGDNMTAAFERLNGLFCTKSIECIDDFALPKYQVMLDNWDKLATMWQEEGAIGHSQMQPILSRLRSFHQKWVEWKKMPGNAAANNQMNSAARAFDLSITKGAADGQVMGASVLANMVEAVQNQSTVSTAMLEWTEHIEAKRKGIKEVFVGRLAEHEKLSGGLREAGSWKALLRSDSSDADVLEAGKILCSGPGGTVLNMKASIAEERPLAFYVSRPRHPVFLPLLPVLMAVFVSSACLCSLCLNYGLLFRFEKA